MHPEHIEADARADRENRMDLLKAIGVIKDGSVDSVELDTENNLHIKETICPFKPINEMKINFTLKEQETSQMDNSSNPMGMDTSLYIRELQDKLNKANEVIKVAKLVNALAPMTVYALIEKVRDYKE